MRLKLLHLFILFSLVIKAGDDPRMDSLNRLIAKYSTVNLDSSIFFAKQALKIAEEEKRSKEQAVMKNSLGQLHAMKGDLATSLLYFSENLESAKKAGNKELVSRCDINIANIYTIQGKYNSALDRYLDALRINEQGKDTALLYVNNLCIGITHYYLKNYSKSLGYYSRCLALCSNRKDAGKKAYCYNAMGIINKETGHHDEALALLEKANAVASEAADSSLLAHNRSNLGELYGLKGDYSKAMSCLQSAGNMLRRFSDNKGLGENLVLLGNVNVHFKNYAAALPSFHEALEMADRIGIREIAKDCHLGLSEAYAGLHQFEEADKERRQYERIKDSLFNATSSVQIADMQTRYETEKKESENLLLVKDNNIQAMEIEQHKSLRNLLIIGFALALIVLALLFNSSRLRSRNRLLLEKEMRNRSVLQAQEQEKMRLSQELHDGLGPLLSLVKLNVSALETNDENRKMIGEIKELTSQGIKEVRTISHALMPGMLQKQGLRAALTEFMEQAGSSGAIRTDFKYDVASVLNVEMEVNLYRIVQEAVNNILKHASAQTIRVALHEKNDMIVLTIADDGKGFEVRSTQSGNGLNNIYSRVDLLKGKVETQSAAGKGTSFLIRIPFNQKTA